MTKPVRFVVQAHAEPQILVRLINFFVQRGLMPQRVKSSASNGAMTVVIEQDGLSDHQAGVIAEKMRATVLVESVRLARDRRLISSV